MKITVLGATNEDHTFTLKEKLRMKDSNPVSDHITLGGVGFNIARTLELTENPLSFLTAFDSSVKPLFKDIIIEEIPKPSYYAVLENDMEIAFASMDSVSIIKGDAYIPHLTSLSKEDILCADLNFEVSLLKSLFKNTHAKIIVEATSAHKVLKVRELIHYITGLKLNLLEAQILTKKESFEEIITALEKMPLKEIILTCGNCGAVVINETVTHTQDTAPFDSVNMSGVGDAFMAGFLIPHENALDQIKNAMTCAYLTAQSFQSTMIELTLKDYKKAKEKRHVRILFTRPRSTQ